MSAEVDENVDAVVDDAGCERIVIQGVARPPMICDLHHSPGHFVILRMAVVAIGFDLTDIMVGEQRLDVIADRVPAKIGRYIANFQTLVRVADIAVHWPRGFSRCFDRIRKLLGGSPDMIRWRGVQVLHR